MKKKVKKEESVKEIVSEVTASTATPVLSETTCSRDCTNCKKIDKLDVDFGRGDLNQMRDKINEIINNGN